MAQLSPEEQAAYQDQETLRSLKWYSKNALQMDGVSNDEGYVAKVIDTTNITACTGANHYMVFIPIDVTKETTGGIDSIVSDDFSASLTAAKTTFKNLHADTFYAHNIGITGLVFVKTPPPTKDQYGNPIPQEQTVLGTMLLCSTTGNKINWDNIDQKQLEKLLLIDWRGTRGTALADRLNAVANSLKTLQSDLEVINAMS